MKKTQLGSKKREGKRANNEYEKDLADRLGGVRQPNSGSLDHRKGDICLDAFLLDSKETKSLTVLILGSDLAKITKEARQLSKEPGLIMTLHNLKGASKEWALIPLNVFEELIDGE